MSDMSTGRIQTGDTYEVHTTGLVFDLEGLRKERAILCDFDHYWVVSILFHQADPELALDDMTCGPDNLVGSNGLFCLLCHRPYRSPRDTGPCTLAPEKKESR